MHLDWETSADEHQQELSACFERIASLLEVLDANGFKINANRKVARILKEFPDDLAQYKGDRKGLLAIDGIGAGSVDRILEFLESGTIGELDRLSGEIPEGLTALLDVPGLGPKTVRRLWQEVEVTSIERLRTAISDGTLESMPRMGEDNREHRGFTGIHGDRGRSTGYRNRDARGRITRHSTRNA